MDRAGPRRRPNLTAKAAHGPRAYRLWPYSLIAGLASLATPLHFDEAFWVSIARLVTRWDRTLYVTAIDNKTPVVYAVSGLLDLLPGPFVLARALLIALLVFACGAALRRLEVPRLPAAVTTLVAALASGLVLSTELPSVVLLLWSLWLLRRRRRTSGMLLAASAVAIDPRVVVLLVVVTIIEFRKSGRAAARPAFAAWSFVAVCAVLVVAVPDLRYAMIELNAASRAALGGPTVIQVLTAAFVVVLPIAMLVWVDGRLRAGGWWFVAAATFIGFASVNPFPHYWMYGILVVPYLVISGDSDTGRRLLAAASLVPLVAVWIVGAGIQTRVVSEHRAAARYLDDHLSETGTFTQFALVPYPFFFADRPIGLDAPGIHYLTWETSRTQEQRDHLRAYIASSRAVLDDGGLSAPEDAVDPSLQEVRAIFLESLDEFPCTVAFGEVTVKSRPPCDAG